MNFSFKSEMDCQARKLKSRSLMQRHANHFPIYIEGAKEAGSFTPYSAKVVIDRRILGCHFFTMMRDQMKVEPEIAINFFLNGRYKLTGDRQMGEVYDRYKDEDGFLYIAYTEQASMGGL
jgi:GABA(A) receptor-associated protein